MSMVSCPKCGFTQPADQYCAKCGVDMQAFKPAPKPLVQRLLRNTTFQVLSVTLLIALGFAYVRQARQAVLAKRVSEIEIAREAELNEQRIAESRAMPPPTTMASENVQAPPPPAPSPVAVAAPAPPQPVSAATTLSATSSAASSRTGIAAGASADLAAKSPSPAPSVGAPTQIRVAFYEIRRPVLATLLAESSQSSFDSGIGVGVVSAIETKLSAQGGGMRNHDAASPQRLQINQPAIFYKGARDPSSGANLGFTVQIVPTAIKETGAELQVDVNRVLRDTSTGVESVNFALPESFVLTKGSALVITGALPHRSIAETDERFYRGIGVLRALSSEEFKSGSSEAVIIIEAK